MRTLIYARFSSTLQNSRSIDDQVALLRGLAASHGWQVEDVFADRAISGAAGIGDDQRPGLSAALARIEAGGIDQLIAESTDRVARHQGDLYTIMERLAFRGCRLWTANDGAVDDITGTIKGLIDSRFRKEMGAKIRRGQAGTVREGRAAGGISYGYRQANRLTAEGKLVRGLRVVDPEQAAIVLRIFREYAAGRSPLAIAAGLNADGIPTARGNQWSASTLAGQAGRSAGILRNRIYIGEVAVGRTRKVLDPSTRRRLTRPGKGEVVAAQAEHLRIVPQDLWDVVEAHLKARAGTMPARQRRPRHLLSGLVRCGLCGGTYSVRTASNWACSSYVQKRACSNNRHVSTDKLERQALAGLGEALLDPAYVEDYVRTYRAESARAAAASARRHADLSRQLAEAQDRVKRLVRILADGGAEFDELRAELRAAKSDATRLADALADVQAHQAIALHPNLAAEYRRTVEHLVEALRDPEARDEVAPTLRSLIDRIVVTPHPTQRGVQLRVEGRLANLLRLATGEQPAPAATPKRARRA